ncbi:MAG: lysine--tRNA ligase [Phycisphaerales bacterium]|nr:lysine--tRNA ligase [Planctomycetota bacterium]MCH8508072.1 lysine--tRNA ligase [Phycisphaerales bacterium]
MSDTTTEHEPQDLHQLEVQRRANRDAVAAMGLDPYGQRTDGLTTLAEARARYDEAADREHQEQGKQEGFTDRRPVVKVAGRIVLRRPTGKLIWLNLRDHTDESFQVAVSKRDCDEQGFATAEQTDLGDLVVAEGPLMRTKTGEVTCWAASLRPASKCLMPPPEKHAGLTDPEIRARRRYIDMWSNPETTRTLLLRSKIVAGIRRLLDSMGFVEVETPMLQAQAGGAAARPFLTHLNALDIDLSLRIAPELYLKRLLVGGMPKVYEINRNFRNEGVDKRHNPEFTAIELYEAYGDVHSVMAVTEAIVREAARVAAEARGLEGLAIPFGDMVIDYAEPFERVTYTELFERVMGFPMDDVTRVHAEAVRHGLQVKGKGGVPLDHLLIANELFEAVAEPTLNPARPTWVMRYPASLSPLTRPCPDDPRFADRADLFIAGMEVGPHYTELNDPDIQEAKFREQLAGLDDEESTFRSFDQDFIDALKVGMPPAGGMGLGIDRLIMLMAGKETIREVIPFPFVRPLDR